MPDEERGPASGTTEEQDRDALDTETTGTATEADTIEAGASGGDDTTVPDHLKWKAKAEKYNELEAENKRLREQLEVGHQPAADIGAQEQQLADLEERRAHLVRLEKAGDVAAWAAREALDENIRLREDFINALHLQNVPESRRAQVMATWEQDQKSGRRNFRNIAEVNAAYERRDLNERVKTLEAENQKLKAGKNGAARVERDDVVRTTGSDHAPPQKATKPQPMTKDEFRRKKQELFASGDERAARQMDVDLRAGKIAFKH